MRTEKNFYPIENQIAEDCAIELADEELAAAHGGLLIEKDIKRNSATPRPKAGDVPVEYLT